MRGVGLEPGGQPIATRSGLDFHKPHAAIERAACSRAGHAAQALRSTLRAMSTTLPAPAGCTDQARADLAEHGICIVPDVLEPAMLQRARAALYRAATDDEIAGVAQQPFALDYGSGNQRVWNVLSRDAVFSQLVEHPLAMDLLKSVLGWPMLLGNLSANIAHPCATGGLLHADQVFVPEPWPPAPQGANVTWLLDDFTADNGATRFVPGSHRLSRNATQSDADRSVPLTGAAGTMVVFESRLWHRTGENRSTAPRAGLFGWYTRPIYRTQENWFLSLDPLVRERASDTLLTLLAYRSEGFGLVWGRSPM